MNDLEFRRQAYADPNSQDEAFLAALAKSPDRQEFVDELKAFDLQLEDALNVPVPENLADEIILGQSFDETRRLKRKSRVHLALAASVAFAAGLSLALLNGTPAMQDLSHAALAHQYADGHLMGSIDEQLSMTQANAKLAAFGGELTSDIGHIYAANFCNIEGIKGVHLVVRGKHGKVSIMLVPPQGDRPVQSQFDDGRYQGVIQRHDKGELIIIGEQAEPLEQWKQKMDDSLQWQSI